MKKAAARACRVAAISAGVLLAAGPGCRGGENRSSAGGRPLDHSQGFSSASSLPFASLSFDEALAKARAEKKYVFVDVYADWCHWCTKMDDDVFADARVQTALLDFVPIKVNADAGGGRGIASRYRVSGLPAFLVVNGDGELVRRFDGYVSAEAFLRALGPASPTRG